MVAPSVVLDPGTVLDGKWKIEGVLGEGGMGAVYRATHLRNSLSVAVKVLHPDLARDKQLRERFLHEGYAANKVGHAGTVRVLDDGQTAEGLVFLVMELLVGETVDAFVTRKGGALSFQEMLPLLESVLETLAAAHAMGTVHRDIKPENLFLTKEGTLKVLDFGLARVREATTQARLTVTGVPMGTPAFMPPEQALAKWDEVTTRSDVYSIGASAWNMLTGALVHEGTTIPMLLVAVSTKPARPIRSVLPQLPEGFASVIDRALAFDPANRWADAGEMLRALRVSLGHAPSVRFGGSSADLGAAFAPTMQMPGLNESVERALRVAAIAPLMTDPPTGDRQSHRGTLPSAAGVPPIGDPRQAVSTGTGTVAPVSSDPELIRRRRRSGVLFAMGAAAVITVSLATAGVFFVVRNGGLRGAFPKSVAASSTPADSLPDSSLAPTEVPMITPGDAAHPSSEPTSAASTTPSASSSAKATKPKTPTTTTTTPKQTKPKPPVDPLSDYKRPGSH